jgi:hypothetical protein
MGLCATPCYYILPPWAVHTRDKIYKVSADVEVFGRRNSLFILSTAIDCFAYRAQVVSGLFNVNPFVSLCKWHYRREFPRVTGAVYVNQLVSYDLSNYQSALMMFFKFSVVTFGVTYF